MFGLFLANTLQLPLLVLLPLVMLLSGGLAVVVELVAFRPLRRPNVHEEDMELGTLISSIGASIILVSAAERLTRADVLRLPPGVFTVAPIELGPILVTNLDVVMFVVAVGLSAVLSYVLQRTKQGKALRAVACNHRVAHLLGINVDRMTSLTFFASGALAGAAGVLLALALSSVYFLMGESLLVKAFAIIILGGVGSVPGALIGGMVLAFSEVATVTFLSTRLRDAVAFGLIVLILLVRPTGLFGARQARSL
jgi:branched-chain amino acid transport system permease protein